VPTKHEKIKVEVDGQEVVAYLYTDFQEVVHRERRGRKYYEYKRKRIVFMLPRDLEGKAILIAPIERTHIERNKAKIKVKIKT